jgi:hypothetical protein
MNYGDNPAKMLVLMQLLHSRDIIVGRCGSIDLATIYLARLQ